ncbi:MAG: flagellar biosynthetic protein FliO [Proteobacteria bacterium]|nr:flagellar biosynthetic protein FliO [Pseudomonadota bacterium]
MLLIFSKRVLLVIILFSVCNSINATEHLTASPATINMSDYFKVLFGLVFVIALFLISTFLFKRYGNASMTGRGQIRLVDGLHLGNRERLVLIEIKDKQILLSITPGQINKIDTITPSSLVENNDA